MEQDIRKLAVWIEQATREQIALQRQILALKRAEKSTTREPSSIKGR